MRKIAASVWRQSCGSAGPFVALSVSPSFPSHCTNKSIGRGGLFPDQGDWHKAHLLEMPFRYPFAKSLVISLQDIEVNHVSDYTQVIPLRWIRTGLRGLWKPRPLFVCMCGRAVCRVYFRHQHLACRRCWNAVYASQKYDQNGRKRLKASKLRLDLGGLPDINEPFPPKPKWTRRRTYQRIRNEIQALEAKAKQTRFRKDIDIRTYGPPVGFDEQMFAAK
jgi:hypothetical protein